MFTVKIGLIATFCPIYQLCELAVCLYLKYLPLLFKDTDLVMASVFVNLCWVLMFVYSV
jgi:hypothetical protein